MKSPAARQRLRWLSFTGAAIVVLCFFILSCMPAVWITGWQSRISDGLISLWNGITESTASHSTVLSLYSLTGPLLHIAGYFLLGMLLWTSLRLTNQQEKAREIGRISLTTVAVCLIIAVVDESLQLLLPGRQPSFAHGAYDLLGAAIAAFGLALFFFCLQKFPKIFNRETISYVFFGALTTVVNIVTYLISCTGFGISNLTSNAIAWVVSVLFAYVVNKLFVFQSKTGSWKAAGREFVLFIAARLFSLAADQLCMFLLVDVLASNKTLAKIAANIIVMIMNYFFSKWFIFARKKRS